MTCNGKKLEFEDFEITSGDTFFGVGPCTLTVTAAENSNYTGSKSAEWTVRPLKIAVLDANVVKTYDGTTDLPANASITFKSVDSMYTGVPLGLSKGTDYQLLDAHYDSADAGEEKTVSFTIKLLEQGYVFADGTRETSLALKGSTVKINKAAAPSMSGIWKEQHVFNDLARTYEIELETLLPERTRPCEYGTVTYGALSVTFTDTAYQGGAATLTNGVLRLPIAFANNSKSEIGTVKVEVNSTNYETFELTLHVIADDKIVPRLAEGSTISATDITYGQTLNGSTLTTTGSMICPHTKAKIPGTFAWKDGKIIPDAGDYEAEWTFTPGEGYEEYAVATGTVTVKVSKAQMQDVSVLVPNTYYYTGEPQRAGVIAAGLGVCGEQPTFTYSKTENGEYTSEVPEFTEEGTYTVYYKAEAANHITATGSFSVQIKPLPISLLSVEKISKTYDGTASVMLSTDMLTFISKTAKATNIKLPDTAITFTNAQFTKKQADGSYLPSPEVGGGKALSFTMTLTSNNYVFEGKSEGTTKVSDVFATDDVNRFTITKAKAPAAEAGALTITNGLEKTYSFDLSALLPKLTAPCEYGTITYGEPAAALDGGTFVTRVNSTTGALTLEVSNRNSDTAGAVGTITVPVTTMNYETFNLIINVSAENKATPVLAGELTLTPAEITYGEPLSKITITGTMKDPTTGATVEGTFSWQQPGDTILNASTLGHDVGWKFTPKNGNAYTEATGTATVKVDKAVQYGEPSMSDYTYGEEPSTPTMLKQTGDSNASVTYYYSVADSGSVQTWDIKNPPVLNAGTYRMLARIGYTDNYYQYETGYCEFVVAKATSAYTKPTGLTAAYGQTLADVTLPAGWSWMDSSEPVGNASIDAKTFQAKFTPADKTNYNTVENIKLDVTVNKANGGSLKTVELEQKYTDTSEHTYTPDWSGLPSGQTWSYSSEYSVSNGSIAKLTKQDIAAANGKLTYAISGGKAGDKITITLKASCDNYEDFTITLNVTLTEKDDQKPLTITGDTSVIYGEKLTLTTTGGSGTGAVTYRIDTANSNGEATIDPETGVLTPVRVGSVSVIAAKAGDKDYNDVTSAPFVLMVKPATPTGAPNYTKITTSGKTLKDAALTIEGSTLNPNVGKLEWVNDEGSVLPDDTRVEANKTYKWRFTPADDNYAVLTGEVELYHKSSSGGGSGSNSGSYTITVKDAQNGDVTTDRKSASAGTTVTITVKPDSGYVLDDLTVTDSKGNDLKLTGKGGGKYTFTMPSGKVTVEASFAPAKSEDPFTDVPSGAYYEDAVIWAVNNGITGGTSATTFDPNGFCTRAQAVTFLWRAAGSPAPKSAEMPFTDVPAGSYYYDAVLWAIENGVTKGTGDTTFSPNANCSRGQIVTFLWRSQKSPDAAAANPFTDVAADAYYTSAVLWAVERNITGGTSATTFSPSANCTRAQIVTFIYRCMK